MKKLVLVGLLFLFYWIYPQPINVNPDPDGDPWYVGGYVLDESEEEFINSLSNYIPNQEILDYELPQSWDNSKLPENLPKCFRSIFLQDGPTCAQASLIGYIFTYEVNRALYASADILERQYPTHFTLVMNGSVVNTKKMLLLK
ncbi:MAG: hypothetical protein GQ534_12095 [Candidatus Delongbacteria bacterium]|nr:hypothetical protein [Candidatus Delongbacteria bacterium]